MLLKATILHELNKVYPDGLSIDLLCFNAECSLLDCIHVIEQLQHKNFPIKMRNNVAYLTLPLISIEEISKETQCLHMRYNYILKDKIASTNNLALNQMHKFEHGTVILTHSQEQGKGRLGRNWTAPMAKSIALSIVLKPKIQHEMTPLFTQLTAAALSLSLKDYVDVKIKWPNDILINKKKVAGILIETNFQGSSLQGVTVGVGINTNLTLDDFNSDSKKKATSLRMETGEVVDPNKLIVRFLVHFNSLYSQWIESEDPSSFISLCKEFSLLLNKVIYVYSPTSAPRRATVMDITNLGELLIQYEGELTLTPLTSLDFSIRGLNGYV